MSYQTHLSGQCSSQFSAGWHNLWPAVQRLVRTNRTCDLLVLGKYPGSCVLYETHVWKVFLELPCLKASDPSSVCPWSMDEVSMELGLLEKSVSVPSPPSVCIGVIDFFSPLCSLQTVSLHSVFFNMKICHLQKFYRYKSLENTDSERFSLICLSEFEKFSKWPKILHDTALQISQPPKSWSKSNQNCWI